MSRTVYGWSPRWARVLLVAIHLPFVVSPMVYALTDFSRESGSAEGAGIVVPIVAGLTLSVLHLRHGFAAARGVRPAGWWWTLALLLIAVYVPYRMYQYNWAAAQYFAVASILMLLRGRARLLALVPPVLTIGIVVYQCLFVFEGTDQVQDAAYFFWYWSLGFIGGGVALFAPVALVRVLEELRSSRTELAQVAVARERLRVSRDLHDLLGQSLSAISLKGDLARRLLTRDAEAARTEVAGLTEVARRALRGLSAVTRDQHPVSLHAEVEAAAALLDAAGVRARVEVGGAPLASPVETALAWAVREGVTNVVRHSQAQDCSIAVHYRGGAVRLEIVNDGVWRAAQSPGEGTGLAGLTERIKAVAGSMSAERLGNDRFRLHIEIPDSARG